MKHKQLKEPDKLPLLFFRKVRLTQVAVVMILVFRCVPDCRHVKLAFVLRAVAQSALATAADHFADERVAEVFQIVRLKQFHVSLLRELGEFDLQFVVHVLGTDVTEVGALLLAGEIVVTGGIGHLERSVGWLDAQGEIKTLGVRERVDSRVVQMKSVTGQTIVGEQTNLLIDSVVNSVEAMLDEFGHKQRK